MPIACVNGILLSVRMSFVHFIFFAKAAHSPKHSGCTVSPGGATPGRRCQHPARFRLLVIFPAPRTSARVSGDKHKNFIGLKDVPAPIATFRSQRH
jgi:hypothetical protein